MIRFKKYLAEAKDLGDCFQEAAQVCLRRGPLMDAIEKDGANENDIRVVHAFVSGQGPLSGKRFEHGWVEAKGTVYDFSNGKKLKIPKGMYYSIGNIKNRKGQYASYTVREARKKLVKHGHFGPWDI